jgi:sulfonate transport system permease protein
MTALTTTRPAGVSRLRRRRVNLPGVLFILGFAVIWEVAVASGFVQVVFFPAPSEIIQSWLQLFLSGQMARDVGHTLSSAGIGWALGSTIGLVLGTWLGMSVTSWRYSMATVDFLRSIPAICFVAVAALLLGFSLQMELVVTTYAAIWPVLINTVEGIRRVDSLHLETARTLQLTRLRTVFAVLLPNAGGSIIVGLRLALGLALTLAVASEMVGNPAGVGFQLVLQQQALQPANMFAYIITIGILGLLLNRLLMLAIRLIHPGLVVSLREEV